MSEFCVVYVTAPPSEARGLAHALLQRRLCACCNLLDATSIYRWDGKVEEAQEVLLIIKTTRAMLPALETAVVELHSYEVPEVVVLPVTAGHAPYLNWLKGEVP